MTVVSGRIAWGSNAGGRGRGDALDFKTDYFRMKDDGDYIIALLEQAPQPFKEHWSFTTAGQKRSVRCAVRDCTLCKEADAKASSSDPKVRDEGRQAQAKTSYAIEVFVLAERGEKLGSVVGRPALFEMTKQVFDGVGAIKNTLDSVGGNLSEAIIHINKQKTRKPDVYRVQAIPRPLSFTEDQKKLIADFKARNLDLSKLYAPPMDADNMKKLGRTGDPSDTVSTGTSTSTVSSGATDFNDDAW